ncbi:MAG: hypothetical protein JSR30_00060 [Proteobacteria bacterium]|nr:hypothetical protein [Pseudomonadota bacterium]
MAKAKAAFSKGGAELERTAGMHGANAGEQLTHSLEHKLLSARHLSGALATALGLNIEHIAESIASGIVGGSKEAWAEAVAVADANTQVIEKLIEARMNPKRVEDKRQRDLERAIEESKGAGAQTTVGNVLLAFGGPLEAAGRAFGLIKNDATILKEKQEATLKINEADLKIEEEKKNVREAEKALDAQRRAASYENLTSSEKISAINEAMNEVIKEITSGNLSDLEVVKKRGELLEMQKKLAAEELAIKQRAQDKERELGKLELSRFETQRKLNRDEKELEDRRNDRGKLTLGELAEVSARNGTPAKREYASGSSTYGISDEVAAARQAARDIQALEDRQNQLRLSGDVAGANALADQISSKRDTLVQGGFLKSTEGDEFRQLKETIHDDNVALLKVNTQIAETMAGKFVNQ